jgi:biotin transport system permease protein
MLASLSQHFSMPGMARRAATSALRLACAASLGVALTVTTRSGDLVDVLEWLLAPLRPLGVQPARLSLQLALMLRFTEHFFVQWQKLDDAHRLRTGRAGGLRLIAPLTVQMLQTARRVGDALFVRLG